MKNRLKLLFVILVLQFCRSVPAECGEPAPRVAYVKFLGAEGVDPDFLSEEISISPGDIYTPQLLMESMRRLENLRLFSSVAADTVKAYGNRVGIIFILEETLHWIITPFIFKDDDYGLIYGIQYAHSNLFGRKYTAYCAGKSGGLKGGQINFSREMTCSRMYGFSTSAELDESEHPVLDYWRRNHTLNVSLQRRIGGLPEGFSIRRHVGISLALEAKEFRIEGISLASDNSDVTVKSTLFYNSEDTDLIYNPGRGRKLNISLSYWNINGSDGIESAIFNGSVYRSISRNFVLAGNLYAELYADSLPLHYRNFLGGYNFRGCSFGDYQGDSYLTSSIELRILPRWRFNIWKSFLEPAAALFSDCAVIGGYRDFYREKFHFGYGISAGLLTPYVSPFFHLAYNEEGELVDYFSLQSSWKF